MKDDEYEQAQEEDPGNSSKELNAVGRMGDLVTGFRSKGYTQEGVLDETEDGPRKRRKQLKKTQDKIRVKCNQNYNTSSATEQKKMKGGRGDPPHPVQAWIWNPGQENHMKYIGGAAAISKSRQLLGGDGEWGTGRPVYEYNNNCKPIYITKKDLRSPKGFIFRNAILLRSLSVVNSTMVDGDIVFDGIANKSIHEQALKLVKKNNENTAAKRQSNQYSCDVFIVHPAENGSKKNDKIIGAFGSVQSLTQPVNRGGVGRRDSGGKLKASKSVTHKGTLVNNLFFIRKFNDKQFTAWLKTRKENWNSIDDVKVDEQGFKDHVVNGGFKIKYGMSNSKERNITAGEISFPQKASKLRR